MTIEMFEKSIKNLFVTAGSTYAICAVLKSGYVTMLHSPSHATQWYDDGSICVELFIEGGEPMKYVDVEEIAALILEPISTK